MSAVISLIWPPTYVAGTFLLPAGVEKKITGEEELFSQLGSFGETYSTFMRVRRNFILNFIVRSRRMSDLLSKRFGLEDVYRVKTGEEVRKELRKRTSLEVRDEGVVVLRVEDRDPVRVKELVDEYTKNLDSLLVELTIENAEATKRFLEDELIRRERYAARADSAMRVFQEKHGAYDIEEQSRAAMEVATVMNARLYMLRIEQQLLAMTMMSGNPLLDRVSREIEELEEQLSSVKESGTELFPPLSSIPVLAVGYGRLLSEQRLQSFALAYIRTRLVDADISVNKRVNVLSVIDPPVVPERRTWPKRKQIVLVSTFAVFFWICFGLVVRDKWKEGAFRVDYRGSDFTGGEGTSGGGRGDGEGGAGR